MISCEYGNHVGTETGRYVEDHRGYASNCGSEAVRGEQVLHSSSLVRGLRDYRQGLGAWLLQSDRRETASIKAITQGKRG